MISNETLTTVYSSKMNKDCPWNEYPRPSLKRDSFICLNGEWDFSYSISEPTEYKEKILVPFPPESVLSGIGRGHKDEEKLYYKRRFSVPEGFQKKRTVLHFGAVDQICEIFLNGVRIGEHKGGYLPFSFDITDVISEETNELKVIAEDNLSHIYPYGKQKKKRGGMWYTPVSGIWQTVWLESLPDYAIESLKITQTAEYATIELKTDSKHKRLTLSESGEVYEFDENSITIKPQIPKLWSPENPYLYHFRIETEEDAVESYFALREIGIKKTGGISRLCLNGKPYLFNGLLDQGYFPDGIFLPATIEGFSDDIKNAKALGFNTLRKHIKIEPEIFYYLCDKLGIAVFQDMVNNSGYSFLRDTALPTVGFKRLSDKFLHRSSISRDIFRSHMKDTLNYLYNHPSILYYTIFNEGWGQFTADEVFEEAKSIDSSRIIDATSGWFVQKKSDVDSHHIYFKKLKLKINPNRPAVISEFGGYSYRCDCHLFGENNYGYRCFEKREDFEDAVANLYLEEALPLVKNGVSALIYTQISDIEDETNGFFTYDRRIIKVNFERFKNISKTLKESII